MSKYGIVLDDLLFKYQRLNAVIDIIESAIAADAVINNITLDWALLEVAEEFKHTNNALKSISDELLKTGRKENPAGTSVTQK